MKKVFISYSLRNPNDVALVDYLRLELMHYGIVPIPADFSPGGTVIEMSQDLIRQCSAVLVIATESFGRETELPASTLFELGYALGLGRKVVIIKHPSVSLPTDLSLLPTIQISSHDPNFVGELMRLLEEPEDDRKPVEQVLEQNPLQLFEFYRSDPNAFEKVDAATFENVIIELFRAKGLKVTIPTSTTVANYDFGLIDYQGPGLTLCETKKYTTNSRVSVGQIQQLMGAVYAERASRGLFIASSDYTRSAIDFANRCEPKIELWTMNDLQKWIG